MFKKYVGAKVVEATPISLEAFKSATGRDPYANNPNPAEDLTQGYMVKYEDGYCGYSPKSVFDAAYREINPFNETMIGMISPDYKERFKAEYYQLAVRLGKLREMLDKWTKGTLGFAPTCTKELLTKQAEVMEQYKDILFERAKVEGIDL